MPPPGRPHVVAHVIVGGAPEPYLNAALDAVAGSCAHAVINDNSGSASGANAAAIQSSAFARSGRLTLLHTRFEDFATARNACIDATPEAYRDGWALRVDADEIFDAQLSTVVALLARLPERIELVDAYSRHFVGSFRYFDEIARRSVLFRLNRRVRWIQPVHEVLEGASGIAVLPAVHFHYGHVVPVEVEEQRGRLYASLGQTAPDHSGAPSTVASMWGRLLRRAIRYDGSHPAAVRPTIDELKVRWGATFEQVDALAASQSGLDRARNWLRAQNYRRLLAWRAIEARLRWGYRASP